MQVSTWQTAVFGCYKKKKNIINKFVVALLSVYLVCRFPLFNYRALHVSQVQVNRSASSCTIVLFYYVFKLSFFNKKQPKVDFTNKSYNLQTKSHSPFFPKTESCIVLKYSWALAPGGSAPRGAPAPSK